MLAPGRTWVILRAESSDPDGGGSGSEFDGATFNASTSGATYRVRVKGPAGCAGQTHTVVFGITSTAGSSVGISGSDTYQEFGNNEADIVEKPSPASSASMSASASGASASASSSASYNFPSAGGDSGPQEATKGLISRTVTFDSAGNAEVEIPFALHLDGRYNTPSVSSEAGDFRPAAASAGAEAAVALFQDTRGVQVVCGEIETSYQKSGTGRTAHLRQTDGSITTTSAAFWDQPLGMWVARRNFDASLMGAWNAPSYSWDAGNTPQTNNTPNGSSFFNPKLLLGGDTTGQGMTGSSTIKVAVTDSGDSAVAKNTFGINWHLPVDNIQEYGTPISTYTCSPAAVVNSYPQSTQAVNGEIKVVVNPTLWNAKLLLSDGQSTLTGALELTLGIATGGPIGVGKMLTGVPFERAVAPWLIAQYFGKVSFSETSAAAGQKSLFNTESEWYNAVASTRASHNGDSSADSRIMPAELVAGDDVDPETWHSCAMEAWVKYPVKARLYRCDEYNAHGYVGQGSGQFDDPQQPEVVGYYNYASSPAVP